MNKVRNRSQCTYLIYVFKDIIKIHMFCISEEQQNVICKYKDNFGNNEWPEEEMQLSFARCM